MANVTTVKRTFLYGGRTLPDPDPRMNTEEVKQFYAQIHPELINASVEGGEFNDDTQVWRFARAVGTKG